jgi:two-component system, sensor histidine kinase
VHVLCLDNEPAVLAGMEALLQGWNCSVELSGSEQAVISRRIGFPSAMARWPQVILADYHLDVGTGIEAIARVRAAAGRQIPAIIITADHSADVQREIRMAGFPHLKKPIKPAALRAALAHALQRRTPLEADAVLEPLDA